MQLGVVGFVDTEDFGTLVGQDPRQLAVLRWVGHMVLVIAEVAVAVVQAAALHIAEAAQEVAGAAVVVEAVVAAAAVEEAAAEA